jgi:hypothetical protein
VRKNVADREREVSQVVEKVTALRTRLLQVAGEVPPIYGALREAIPDRVEQLKRELAAEWQKGCAGFAATVAKRRGIEELIGHQDLPDPEPGPIPGVSVVSPCHDLAEKLRAVTSRIGVTGGGIGCGLAPILTQGCEPPQGSDEAMLRIHNAMSDGRWHEYQKARAASDRGELERSREAMEKRTGIPCRIGEGGEVETVL